MRSRYEDVDLVVVRENTEDLYAGIEFERGHSRETPELIDGSLNRHERQDASARTRASSIKPISITGTGASSSSPSTTPETNGRKKVTAVTQGEHHEVHRRPLPRTSRARSPSEYPDIEFQEVLVDNMCMQLVQKPEDCTTCWCCRTSTATSSPTCAPAWWAGSAWRLAPTSATDAALFEPVHGSAPKYAGQNKVNPTATMLSGVLMLRHLGETEAADRLETAHRRR